MQDRLWRHQADSLLGILLKHPGKKVKKKKALIRGGSDGKGLAGSAGRLKKGWNWELTGEIK